MKNLIKITGLLLFIALFTTCQKEPVLPTFNDIGNIGTQGGIVETEDGASVEIPEGALSSNQTISITNVTAGDTVVNSGCTIYDLKPDGINFNDSVIVTLPFNNEYLKHIDQIDNNVVGIMVYQDTCWIKLSTTINLENNTVSAKTTHFSRYMVYFPSYWTFYFAKYSDKTVKKLKVPHYTQGDSDWCGYYSLSMLTRYAGFPYHAPYYASLMNVNTDSGLSLVKLNSLEKKLTDNLGIQIERAYPAWGCVSDLCGYILKKLDDGFPVWVGSKSIMHAFVVTGHDETGFYINDPSGSFLNIALNKINYDKSMIHVPYLKFIKGLINLWDVIPVPGNVTGSENTLVILNRDHNNLINNGLSINFPIGLTGLGYLKIFNNSTKFIGDLEFDGKKFNLIGYSLVNKINNGNIFNNTDYFEIKPFVDNSSHQLQNAKIYYKIDNTETSGSPIYLENIPVDNPKNNNEYYPVNSLRIPFSNIQNGSHTLSIELRSEDSGILYDSWEFPFIIKNSINETGTFEDSRDGKFYKWVKIGDQTWMAENLAYLPSVSPPSEESFSEPVFYVYGYEGNNVSEAKAANNYKNYGVLYNWQASKYSCPDGWHLPSDDEWKILERELGMSITESNGISFRGTSEGLNLKSKTDWYENGNGNDMYGFTVRPAGYRDWVFNTFTLEYQYSFFWSATTATKQDLAWSRFFWYPEDRIGRGDDNISRGFSVRCVKND